MSVENQSPNSENNLLKPDKLDELFRLQKLLNERIGIQTDKMTDEERIKWILNYCRAMSQEIAELTDSVPWKWWAKYQQFNKQNAKVEVIDLLHFLISLAQVLGMNSNDLYEGYVKKNKINFVRQETGYTNKDENDCKAI
ncbi:MAG TPA: dUTPase [Verrucomicrobiota bacterium]|nr:dUTPase [Verrucomicrobiota bacterium]